MRIEPLELNSSTNVTPFLTLSLKVERGLIFLQNNVTWKQKYSPVKLSDYQIIQK